MANVANDESQSTMVTSFWWWTWYLSPKLVAKNNHTHNSNHIIHKHKRMDKDMGLPANGCASQWPHISERKHSNLAVLFKSDNIVRFNYVMWLEVEHRKDNKTPQRMMVLLEVSTRMVPWHPAVVGCGWSDSLFTWWLPPNKSGSWSALEKCTSLHECTRAVKHSQTEFIRTFELLSLSDNCTIITCAWLVTIKVFTIWLTFFLLLPNFGWSLLTSGAALPFG